MKINTNFYTFASVILTGALLLAPMANATDELQHKVIEVQGRGVITAKPDSFSLNFTVTSDGKTMSEAKQKNNTIASVITTKIKALGIPNLTMQTQWYNATPTYKYDKSGRSSITGYQVNNSMTATVKGVDSNKIEDFASKVLDTAVDNKATNTGDPNFYLSDNNVVYDDALKLAVKQARHRADILATESGTAIESVDVILSDTQSSPQTMAVPRMMAMSDGAAMEKAMPTQVMAGPLDVQATVTIRYRIK